MPVYLFTYHTYGSWMPDRPQGYVKSKQGILPQNRSAAKSYRTQMKQEAVLLKEEEQREVVEALLEATPCVAVTVHSIATEPTHLHILASWKSDRSWELISNSLKRAVTKRLQVSYGKRQWLSSGRSRKQVQDREHFEHLMFDYLPKHSGLKWNERCGFYLTLQELSDDT